MAWYDHYINIFQYKLQCTIKRKIIQYWLLSKLINKCSQPVDHTIVYINRSREPNGTTKQESSAILASRCVAPSPNWKEFLGWSPLISLGILNVRYPSKNFFLSTYFVISTFPNYFLQRLQLIFWNKHYMRTFKGHSGPTLSKRHQQNGTKSMKIG